MSKGKVKVLTEKYEEEKEASKELYESYLVYVSVLIIFTVFMTGLKQGYGGLHISRQA